MFSLTVEDVFHIKGRGTVVTGQVAGGPVRVGDMVTLDGGRTVKVDGVEMFRKIVDVAQPGDNVGLLLGSITKDDVKPGMVIAPAGPGAGAPAAPVAPAPTVTSDAFGEQPKKRFWQR